MSIVSKKMHKKIDDLDTTLWDVSWDAEKRREVFTLKPESPPQTVTIIHPDGTDQKHNNMPPGSTIAVSDSGGVTVTV